MSDSRRSISFTMDGSKNDPSLLINVVELENGTLEFTYLVQGNSELKGLFFDFNNDAEIENLSVSGSQITNQQVGDEAVVNLKDGNNMQGRGENFDIGMTFGTSGKGQDQTSAGTFVLSSSSYNTLTLDDIANVTFGARFSSKGLKLVTISPAAPDAIDDTIGTDEDTTTDENLPNATLLANDTDADGDQLTIIEINGNSAKVGAQFQLATGGLLTVNSDGTFDLDPNSAYEDLAVGETRVDSFTYRITDELADPNNQGFDTATAIITIEGRNDAPIISIEASDSIAETVIETNGTLVTAGSLSVFDVDLSDVVKASVMSVTTGGVNADASTPSNAALKSMLSLNPESPAVLLDGTENSDELSWAFNSSNERFNYLADDEVLTLDYTVRAADDNGAYDEEVITITVDGTNDRPIARNISASVGEDDASVQANFVASDVDTSDILSYEIIAQPVDSSGHQYGQVINNNDGSFSFLPGDNFQFLESGESRVMTFDYVAIDDSGTATDTSVAKTASITVIGADDAPTNVNANLLYTSMDQSMWDTGPALLIDWREFYGIEWDEDVSKTLVSKQSTKLIPSIEVLGVEVYGGLTVSSPKISFAAGTSGRVGVSPYFQFDSGSVDTSIPINVDLTYDVQYEAGDSVSVSTSYMIQNGAYFDTSSPSVTVGLDLVFEMSAYAKLKIGSSSFGSARDISLLPSINVNIDEGAPVAGYPTSGDGSTKTLFELSSADGPRSDIFTFPTGQGGDYTIPIFDDSSLVLSFPDIDTTGNLTGPDRLTSTGSDDVAILTLDLDDILSQSKYVPPMRYTGSKSFGFKFDLPGVVNEAGWDDIDITLAKASWDFELIDVDLIGTLSAVQDFTLDIDELPLILTLENGDTVTGFNMGDTIQFDLPNWDVDTLGDADGQMDYSLDIDMKALFNNWTTLDFDLALVLRALKANFTADTFVTSPVNINAFGSAATNYFAYEDEFDLLNVSPIAELWGDEDPAVSQFELIGFNSEQLQNAFDIA